MQGNPVILFLNECMEQPLMLYNNAKMTIQQKQEKDDSAVYAIMCWTWVGLTLITAPTVQS